MVAPILLQSFFSGLATVAAVSSWVQDRGQMRALEGYSATGQSCFECPPRADVVRAPAVLPALPAIETPHDEDALFAPFSMAIGKTPDQVFPGLLEALNYVTERTDIEHAITLAQGSYHVYSGDEDNISYPRFETVILHTHGEGIALPSSKDLVDIWKNHQRDPAYSTYIYSRPSQTHELSYLQPTAPNQLSIWHWQDRFDSVNKRHTVRARAFQLLFEMNDGAVASLFVEEHSLFGGLIAQHLYSAENCEAIGDEQAFWQLVLSTPVPSS